MPYVQRSPTGEIIALFKEPLDSDSEFLTATDPEIISFTESEESTGEASLHALEESDRDLARVTEDLISLLVTKNMILFTELPPIVQKKLLAREKLRSTLQDKSEDFLDDSESL